MDLVIEKLSTLESLWRISSKEIVELIQNKQQKQPEDEEEFDIFKFKAAETMRILDVIDELIRAAAEDKKQVYSECNDLLIKIEEEVKELGVPIVLQPLNPQANLPRQLNLAQEIWSDLQGLRDFMCEEKERLRKECLEMYKEEMETFESDGNYDLTSLPNWIHELFKNCSQTEESSFTEDSSFTTAAISHLDSAIENLDPFALSLAGTLEKIQEAHQILKGRLLMFQAEYETLWQELKSLSAKLSPFDSETELISIELESKIILDGLGKDSSDIALTRSKLRKVSTEWKRIEKERSESISGSILLIGRLWNLLETPQEERFPLSPTDLSLNNIKLLSQERNRLINFQQQKFKELYDSQVVELQKLMTALRWNETRQQAVLSNCQSYTADGLQHLSRQLAALQPKLEQSLQIISSITSRYALIAKMREFEKSASDPARLFRSSFQLLQEEKFRKTALPSLLNLETQLKSLLAEYKLKFEEEFIYYDENEGIADDSVPFIVVLEEEISGRFMSSGIFGFDQSKQRKERQGSSSSSNSVSSNGDTIGSTPRYSATNNTNNTSNINTSSSRKSPPSIGVIPQRRKLNK